MSSIEVTLYSRKSLDFRAKRNSGMKPAMGIIERGKLHFKWSMAIDWFENFGYGSWQNQERWGKPHYTYFERRI